MAKERTLDEWIAFYNRKAPEPFERNERFQLFYLPDKGFCEVNFTEDMAVIHQLAGDALFWRKHIVDAAKKLGIKKVGTWCIRRNVKAYARLFGFRVTKEENLPPDEKGGPLTRYHGMDSDGRAGLASPAWRYQNGDLAWLITCDI